MTSAAINYSPSPWLPPVVLAPRDQYGVMPRLLACSSMFAAHTGRGRGGKVVYTKETPLVTMGDTPAAAHQIVQKAGPRLNQYHLDIWLQLVRAAYSRPLDASARTVTVSIGAREMLAAIGRQKVGGKDIKWLRERLTDLRAATFFFPDLGGKSVTTGLVHSAESERNDDGRYDVMLDAKLAALFGVGWNRLDLAQRTAMTGKTNAHMLAQWLHTFYTSHERPIPYKGETLQRLCGRQDDDPKDFRELLKDAVTIVAIATPWTCRYSGKAGATLSVFRSDVLAKKAKQASADTTVQSYTPSADAKLPSLIAKLTSDDQVLVHDYINHCPRKFLVFQLRQWGIGVVPDDPDCRNLVRRQKTDEEIRQLVGRLLDTFDHYLEPKMRALRNRAAKAAAKDKP